MKSSFYGSSIRTPNSSNPIFPSSLTGEDIGDGALSEIEMRRGDSDYVVNETWRGESSTPLASKTGFSVAAPPCQQALMDAGKLDVIDSKGKKVGFGSLVSGRPTIVIFIRHCMFGDNGGLSNTSLGLCPLDAQYMKSVISSVDLATLQATNTEIIIIGNGSAKMIECYRGVFRAIHIIF